MAIRPANMLAFAMAALQLLEEAVDAAPAAMSAAG
jgi:hypothetical protein